MLGYDDEKMKSEMSHLSASESMNFKSFLSDDRRNNSTDTSQANSPHHEPNGYPKDKKNLERSPPNDQPDSSAKQEDLVVGVDQLLRELKSVAMVMKEARGVEGCSCSMPFEQHNIKVAVVGCGVVVRKGSCYQEMLLLLLRIFKSTIQYKYEYCYSGINPVLFLCFLYIYQYNIFYLPTLLFWGLSAFSMTFSL